MNETAARAVGFAVAVAVVFAVATGLGAVIGPDGSDDAAAAQDGGHDGEPAHGDAGDAVVAPSATEPVGLQSSQAGLRLRLVTERLAPGRRLLAFHVLGRDGEPVVDYDVQHEKRLHLIVVRRDLTGFQHVHPRLSPGGEWRVPVTLGAGTWRVIADFKPAGQEPLVLGTDLFVPGQFDPRPFGPEQRKAAVDGYRVALDGDATPGAETSVTTSVSRDDKPVTDLQPYLGAHGHLVALRAGDLGYLHVHPDGGAGAGPDIPFHTTFPSAGRYRMFLDFRHAGEVRTAAFSVHVGGAAAPAGQEATSGGEERADHDH